MKLKLNKSDWKIIALIYFVYSSVRFVDYYDRNASVLESFIDISSYLFFCILIVLAFLYWLIPNYLIKSKKYFVFILFATSLFLFTGVLDYTVDFLSEGVAWEKYPTWREVILDSIFRMTDMVGILLGIILMKKFYESQTEMLEIAKQNKENELKLLRSQLDPHFLFNNLNTLDILVDKNPKKAKEYINRLSLIYRYLIQTKDTEVMEIYKELELAENYIFLIQTRFGSDYEFAIDSKFSIDDKFIPTGALQTLLENVVKHNKAIKKQIKTKIVVNDNSISVINNKGDIKEEIISFGTGLKNLKIRYKNITDDALLIENSEDEFRIKIPIVKLENE